MKLSICIPTYNRKKCLEETLTSILSQFQDEVEIVISDNHSVDGTEEFISRLQQEYPHIIYHRWKQEVPCGDNLLKAVELAHGEYCWLMTDDDRIESGGVEHVLHLLAQYPNLTGISVDVEGYDKELKLKKKIRYSHRLKEAQLFLDAEKAYEKLGAWFGFWSAHIIHRAMWMACIAQGGYTPFVGYHHLYLILKMLHNAPRWLFTDKKCVGYRSDNESFYKEYGRLKRFEIDAFSYTTIGNEFFSRSAVKTVNGLVIRNLLFWQMLRIKCESPSLKLLRGLFKVSFIYYKSYLYFWCMLFPLFLMPSLALKCVRYYYRSYKRLV